MAQLQWISPLNMVDLSNHSVSSFPQGCADQPGGRDSTGGSDLAWYDQSLSQSVSVSLSESQLISVHLNYLVWSIWWSLMFFDDPFDECFKSADHETSWNIMKHHPKFHQVSHADHDGKVDAELRPSLKRRAVLESRWFLGSLFESSKTFFWSW